MVPFQVTLREEGQPALHIDMTPTDQQIRIAALAAAAQCADSGNPNVVLESAKQFEDYLHGR